MIEKGRTIVPVFEVSEIGRGARVAADEGDAADWSTGREKFLGCDDGADGVGAEVIVEVREGAVRVSLGSVGLVRVFEVAHLCCSLCGVSAWLTRRPWTSTTCIRILHHSSINHQVVYPL